VTEVTLIEGGRRDLYTQPSFQSNIMAISMDSWSHDEGSKKAKLHAS